MIINNVKASKGWAQMFMTCSTNYTTPNCIQSATWIQINTEK